MKHILGIVIGIAVLSGAAAAERLVSLSPTLTEIVFALGGGERLVGRSSACDYPAAALEVPVMGNFAQPVFEKIILQNPDCIISDVLQDVAVRKSFEELGIPVEILPLVTLDDYPKAVARLGVLLDKESEAAALIADFQAQREQLLTAVSADGHAPRTLVLLWDSPFITCGNQAFLNEYLHLAGAVNLANDEARGYFTCSVEWILSHEPEVIIVMSAPELAGQPWSPPPGWEVLPAVRDGRVYTYCDDGSVSRLGPRWADGVAALRRLIQP